MTLPRRRHTTSLSSTSLLWITLNLGFSHVRSVTNQSLVPPVVSHCSKMASNPIEQAELFYDYFFFVFSPCPSLPSLFSLSFLSPCRYSGMVEISLADVFRALCELDHSKAMVTDGIGPKILKSCANALCEPLHYLFHVSHISHLSGNYTVCIPFTSQVLNLVSNYRPISLL